MKLWPTFPGVHSIPEWHTDYPHILHYEASSGATIREGWKYSSGQLPPRYPVPAIIVETEILPDRVISWSGYGHTTDYKYLAFNNEAYY